MKPSLSAVPRVKIANLPTALEKLSRLGSKLGVRELWIKRDDLTGLAFGGNKTRKLEYLIAEALSHGAKTLLTAGAPQSNHCRQTAAAAAKFGFDCVLVLTGEAPGRLSGNLLLDHLFGAEIVWCEKGQREQTLQEVFQRLWQAGRRPYLIPYGGSNPLGVCAYAQAMVELVEQNSLVDWIIFASSSGGTQAGLVIGNKLTNGKSQIVGISVDLPAEELQKKIFDLIQQTIDAYSFSFEITRDEICVNDSYRGKGYGYPTEADLQAVRDFARYEGILLDPVYTGRAAAGMFDLIEKGVIARDAAVLFWHTGGNPALFAEPYAHLLSAVE